MLGMLNAHGLLEEPPVHEAPEIDQPENRYPEFGDAVIEMLVPAA